MCTGCSAHVILTLLAGKAATDDRRAKTVEWYCQGTARGLPGDQTILRLARDSDSTDGWQVVSAAVRRPLSAVRCPPSASSSVSLASYFPVSSDSPPMTYQRLALEQFAKLGSATGRSLIASSACPIHVAHRDIVCSPWRQCNLCVRRVLRRGFPSSPCRRKSTPNSRSPRLTAACRLLCLACTEPKGSVWSQWCPLQWMGKS
jgi:hypothetical protein